jgi:uncharacterized membrane protein
MLFYLLETKHWVLYWAVLVLLLAVKEDVPFLVFMIAPYVFWRHSRRAGLSTAALAGGYWVLIRWVLPGLIGFTIGSVHWDRFDSLGAFPEEMAFNLLNNPLYIVQQLNYVKISYLLYLFLQGGFLAVISPLIALAAVPAVLINLVMFSSWQAQPIGTYYAAPIVAVLLCGALYGYVVVKKINAKIAGRAFGLLVVLSLMQGMLFSPAPHGLAARWEDYTGGEEYEDLKAVKALVPDGASIATQNNVGAHFAAREKIFSLQEYKGNYPDYVLVHIGSPVKSRWSIFFSQRMKTYIGKMGVYERSVTRLISDDNYFLLNSRGDFYLFQHRTLGDGRRMTREQRREVAEKLLGLKTIDKKAPGWASALESFFALILYGRRI